MRCILICGLKSCLLIRILVIRRSYGCSDTMSMVTYIAIWIRG